MVLTTAESGLHLFISPHTVSRHVRHLCKKCGAKNIIHLISMFSGISHLAPYSGLTRKENQIVSLLAQGMTQREIAEETGLSIRTVFKHREDILAKLNVRSTREAVVLLCRAQRKAADRKE